MQHKRVLLAARFRLFASYLPTWFYVRCWWKAHGLRILQDASILIFVHTWHPIAEHERRTELVGCRPGIVRSWRTSSVTPECHIDVTFAHRVSCHLNLTCLTFTALVAHEGWWRSKGIDAAGGPG